MKKLTKTIATQLAFTKTAVYVAVKFPQVLQFYANIYPDFRSIKRAFPLTVDFWQIHPLPSNHPTS